MLNRIIDKRYGLERDTLLIGNVLPSGLPKALGDSIMSRARETGGVLECPWPGFRDPAGSA